MNYFLPEPKRFAKIFGIKIRYVSADSLYASNRAYKEVRERFNAISSIRPCRRGEFRGEALWLPIGGCVICRGFVDSLMLGGF